MNKNETETNWDTLDKVIEEFPDEKSPDIMEDCGNKELDDSNQSYLNGEYKTGIYE